MSEALNVGDRVVVIRNGDGGHGAAAHDWKAGDIGTVVFVSSIPTHAVVDFDRLGGTRCCVPVRDLQSLPAPPQPAADPYEGQAWMWTRPQQAAANQLRGQQANQVDGWCSECTSLEQRLARAIVSHRHRAEAERVAEDLRGPGAANLCATGSRPASMPANDEVRPHDLHGGFRARVDRVLEIMWSRTKPDAVAGAKAEAKFLVDWMRRQT